MRQLRRGSSITVVVARVIDGGTLEVQRSGVFGLISGTMLIALYGVDAPQIHDPFGRQSAEGLRGLIHGRLHLEIIDVDRYGRLLCIAFNIHGRSLNEVMVESGWATCQDVHASGNHVYGGLELAAKAAGLGIWGDSSALPQTSEASTSYESNSSASSRIADLAATSARAALRALIRLFIIFLIGMAILYIVWLIIDSGIVAEQFTELANYVRELMETAMEPE